MITEGEYLKALTTVREYQEQITRQRISMQGTYVTSIISFCAERFGLTPDDIMSKERHYDIVLARHFAMYFLHRKLKMNLTNTGLALEKHHATIIHGVKRIEHELTYNVEINEHYAYINEKLEKFML